MKFMRGVLFGTIVTAGAMMMCSEEVDCSKKRMMKKGMQFAKRMKRQVW